MTLGSRLRRFSYHPWVIRAVRALGLRPIGRRVYYWLARPREAVFECRVGSRPARFLARTPGELRGLEAGWLMERELLRALESALQPGDTMYDVGSYQGLYAVAASLLVGPSGCVAAFEPDARSRGLLETNVQLNGVRNVRVLACALGDRVGEGTLYAGDVSGNASLRSGGLVGPATRSETVVVARGDDVRAAHGLPLPVAVKIDVEGWEYEVLLGLRDTLSDPRCRLVLCEIHPQFLPSGRQPEDIIRLLDAMGFQVERPAQASRDPFAVVARRAAKAEGERPAVREWAASPRGAS